MTDMMPIVGAWVCRTADPSVIGAVTGCQDGGADRRIEVDFGPSGKDVMRPGEWGCGLQPGFVVQDVPLSNVRSTRGTGTVLRSRELAARHQALIQFHSDGQLAWLPFEGLRRIMGAALQYRRGHATIPGAAERLALNVTAHMLKSWNEATGALDRLDVDPLPHQIALVHRIVNSGQTNWLIADDVGLGKTIEVGLLLAALERRQALRRILIVVPSSLTQQWKEEMEFKFDRQFQIYGSEFNPTTPRDWGHADHVIAPLDLAKPRDADDGGHDPGTRFGMLLAAGTWDIVIFDEAHRLSRSERGRATLRFRLAEALRSRTDAIVMLTGTPHQGDQGKFRNLLTLLRPDLRDAIAGMDDDPDVVREIILRNRKIDAVDIDGRFLFHGIKVVRIEIAANAGFATLETRLRRYLTRGYTAGDAIGGAHGRAVGFVMTIYRKMASSSPAALYIALTKRLARLGGTSARPEGPLDPDAEEDDDLARRTEESPAAQFFEGEAQELEALIDLARQSTQDDTKRARLIDLVTDLAAEGRKVVIFTEYRTTQLYLFNRIEAHLGFRAAMINGGMTVDEKRAAIAAFDADCPVLISTEAGGEGLNMHRHCHVLINYDLPWNPSKLTQRIGRLYRYGQTHKVIVFNFHARDTIDNEIVATILDRISLLVGDMRRVGGDEFDDRYAADVLGELLDRVDVSDLLDEARSGAVVRTQERIDAALREAQNARRLQDDVLSHVQDPAESTDLSISYTTTDVARFVVRAAPCLDIAIEPSGDPEAFTLRLPDDLRGVFAEFGNRTVIKATTRRRGWLPNGDVALLDFHGAFLRYLISRVTAADFGGSHAAFTGSDGLPDFFAVYLARYQDDQGRHQGERPIIVRQDNGPADLADGGLARTLMASPLRDAETTALDVDRRAERLAAASDRAELAMAADLTRFKHANDLVLLAVGERGRAPLPDAAE